MTTSTKRIKQQEVDDLASIMSSVHGRRFIMRLLSPLDREAAALGDATTTYYNLGVQSAAHIIRRDLMKHHFDSYKLMLSEFYSDDEESPCTKDE
jgi:hypothetical protein